MLTHTTIENPVHGKSDKNNVLMLKTYEIVIGIDPDASKSGVGVVFNTDKQLSASVMDFPTLCRYLDGMRGQSVLVIVEAGWLVSSNWHLIGRKGVRRAESTKRAKRYKEPTECRFYGSKKEHVEAYYPILDWTDDDVVGFIKMRGIKLHPLYYRDDGTIDTKRRLGCLCCPLASANKRKEQFKKYPNMVKFYIRAAKRYIKKHPETNVLHKYENVYEWFYRDVFCKTQNQFNESKVSFFGKPNYKRFLEEYFNIELQ